MSAVKGDPCLRRSPSLDPGERLYDNRRSLHYDKPRLRGWLHLVCFEASLVIGTLLIVAAQGAGQTAIAGPAVFGYHEVFHLFVSVAAACQYVAIACFLL